MSGRDRRPWRSATALTQELLDACADNMNCRVELACEIELPDGSFAYLSDRNKYVGGRFYEARLTFPTIARTVGEWLAPDVQFSGLQIDFSNVDGKFNAYLPGGDNYGSWIGKTVTVRIGLSDIESTYSVMFKGTVTDIAGQKRASDRIILMVRDRYDSLNVTFPPSSLNRENFPDLADEFNNQLAPVIYGNWTESLEPEPASIPAIPLNSNNPAVNQAPWEPLQLFISSNANQFFDPAGVYLLRSDIYSLVPASEIIDIFPDNTRFTLLQNSSSWVMDAEGNAAVYNFASGDKFYVKVIGKAMAGDTHNIILQALDILQTYGGLTPAETDASWAEFAAKPQIASVKSRIWENTATSVLQYALSLLEQVRLEAFISRTLKMTISSLRFEDWPSHPGYIIQPWDIAQKSAAPQLDDKNNFNRARGLFDRRPTGQTQLATPILRNQAAINAAGKAISKDITFPNLYVMADATRELTEILKLASSYLEHVPLVLNWRSALLDLGDFVILNLNTIPGLEYTNVPCLVREIGVDAVGLQIPCRLWSLQLVPYGSYNPGYSGIVGGEFATITEET